MHRAAKRAPKRKTYGKRAKPRAMVAHRQPRHDHHVSPQHAEGLALRMALRLSADQAPPSTRAHHGIYIDGFIGALQSAGMLTDQRAIVLRNACHSLLGGQITIEDYAAIATTAIDPEYVKAVQHVRRARAVSADSVATALNIPRPTARQHIQRMQDSGILNAADMFGVHTLHVAEVFDV